MDYQNTDDAIKRDACEKLKQIVKAIKAIKIKYYLIFSKISPKDKALYDALEKQLEEISEKHDLHKLKVALMSEVNARYTPPPTADEEKYGPRDPQSIIDLCYGAIDAQKEALSQGRISQAIRSQNKLEELKKLLDEKGRKEVIKYKREKFAELGQKREQLECLIAERNKEMKGMYKPKHVKMRIEAKEIVKEVTKVPIPMLRKKEIEIVQD